MKRPMLSIAGGEAGYWVFLALVLAADAFAPPLCGSPTLRDAGAGRCRREPLPSRGRPMIWKMQEEGKEGKEAMDERLREGKQSFKDPFRHIEILAQMRARSVAAHSEKSVLFRPHAEI